MKLSEFFRENKKTAVAFSVGTDSAYLLYAALKYGAEAKAYYVSSQFQPEFELDDAKRLAYELNADMKIIVTDILAVNGMAENPPDRCYLCKRRIFSLVAEEAHKDGFTLLCDGTNASDSADDRPGMRALKELSVRSPLRECGITKNEVRELSREAGLFTWDKPAYACLATRFPQGEFITAEKLSAAEKAEAYLASLGFSDFRVRSDNGNARLELRGEQTEKFLQNREEIIGGLKKFYSYVNPDAEVRK